MAYKNFRANIIIRILLITTTLFFILYCFFQEYRITPYFIIVVLVLEVISLIKYIDRVNRDLAGFLESIRHSEFTRTFDLKGLGSSFRRLHEEFNQVMDDFKKVRAEKEENYHYLQSVVQNLTISIIAYTRDGKVELINHAAKKLFQVGSIKKIQDLKKLSTDLVKALLEVRPGENKLVRVYDKDDILHLAIHSTEIKIKDKLICLVSINNIQNVLEETETEAWQKLIRVLTHEIMNSIAPISSLSTTLEQMLMDKAKESYPNAIDYESISEIGHGIKTINNRSNGLLQFVETYRNLTRIPKPNFKIMRVRDLFDDIKTLFDKEVNKKGIKLECVLDPENIEIFADEQQIEQVLINLVQNAIQALETTKTKRIILKCFYNRRGRVLIQVLDSGQGILPDVLEKIFIPFFTTKQQGSGIGLSLSRQVLRMHNGTISAQSTPNKETIFTLTF